MAGPFFLDPGHGKTEIPTWPAGHQTRVIVYNRTPGVGHISMKAGASPPESSDVQPGEVNFDRDFGGVWLTVQNDGKVPLEVKTQ
jgi:hypothetical protein